MAGEADHPTGISIRQATRSDRVSVEQVIESALLEIDPNFLETALQKRDVLVAMREDPDQPDQSHQSDRSDRSDQSHLSTVVLGTIVLDITEIVALAVRPRCRGQGIGSALVDAAGEHRQLLVCEFDDRVIDFWRTCGFDIEGIEGTEGTEGTDRYRGRRPAEVSKPNR